MTENNNLVSTSDSLADQALIQKLELAIASLLWPSEAEYPFQVYYWQDAAKFNQNALLQHHNHSPELKIAIQEFPSFFASVTEEQTWHNEEEKAEIKRYQTLVDLMTKNLTDIRVYLLGEVEIDVYILGETPHKAIAGLTTKIVAT
ncbi:MAG: nuclease A inhibitor family protein [Pleurocapsa sp.]